MHAIKFIMLFVLFVSLIGTITNAMIAVPMQ